MKKEIYLDNAATTKTDEKVVKAMNQYFNEKYGNASSLHLKGEEAKRGLEEARDIIARKIKANSNEIIFTGSGTEANNFALKGLFFANCPKKDHIITTKIEHDCVLNTCKWLESKGCRVTYLDVDEQGFVNPKDVERAIISKTFVVSIIHGNNEIGTIQNIREIGRICKKKGVLFHTDACQSFAKVPIHVKKDNIDLMTINAHKIHGPKGVGALYIKRKKGIRITPLLHGGGQEFKLRSSTENVPGIIGFGKAVKRMKRKHIKKMRKLRDYFIDELMKIPKVKLNGPTGKKRLCNNINICFKNIEGESIGSFLNAKGIYTSTGSACSSKSLEPSHVLSAIGLDDLEANSSIRMSLSKYNKKEDIDFAVDEIKKTVEKLRKISPLQ
ncbi:aminotransferase class V-fold PLP-dependent enzyme [Candidatus Pacearchaeota archaeon]|nr:aminotransferase class V-fold PLP-dependent enzyme [Candidatus Pacearchaeota archaeon]